MTAPVPPFFSSSILEDYPVLNTAGPAPGIPLVIQMLDRVVWFPYSAYGLRGDDAIWGNVAIALAEASPFCNRVVAAAGQFSFNAIDGPLGMGAVEIPAYNLIFEGQAYLTQFNMFTGGSAIYCQGTIPLVGAYQAQGNGTKLLNFVVDGTSVPSNVTSIGVDIGSAPDLEVNIVIQNFTATGTSNQFGANPLGAVGFCNANRNTWTEKMRGHVVINNCTNAIEYVTLGSASTSHMYQDMSYHINLEPHQNALVIARQGHVENGRLRMYGNMWCDSNPNSASAIVLGVGNQAGHFYRVRMEIYVESDPGSTPTADTPFTITYGTNTDNQIQGCHGFMRFLDGFQSSNLPTVEPGYFVFFGPIVGDSVLSGISQAAGTGDAAVAAGQPYVSAVGFYDGAGGIYVNSGDYFKFTLTANITISLAPNPNPGVIPGGGFGAARHIIIVITQAAGGGKTVAWPHPGSPTVGNPTVLWAGGAAPTMSPGGNAVDMYELQTVDGITYYGRPLQNVS